MWNDRLAGKAFFGFIAVLMIMSFAAAEEPASLSTTGKRIEEENRESLRPTEAVIVEDIIPPSPRLKKILANLRFDHGGWVTARALGFNNTDNDKSLADSLTRYSTIDARYWMKWLFRPQTQEKNEHQVYVRFKDRYIRRSGNAPGERFDMDGPHLDQAYTILDFRPIWVEAGRRYFNVGKGIVYSDVNDGLQLNFRIPGFNVGVFAAHTLPFESNIDASVPGYDKTSDRYFYGVGMGYTGIKNHSLYTFAMVEHDDSDEKPSSDRDYKYNAGYAGIGSKGDLGKDWTYWIELIRQTGSSRIYDTNERKDIEAWASDMEVTFAPNQALHPKLTFEYAFGSGDADRNNVTDTQFGNARGSDQNFMYFGYIPTGYALAPRLSNLHMLRVGFEVSPLEHWKPFKRLTMGLDFYQFLKHRTGGGIYDSEAVADSRDIGREADAHLRWKVNSRLSVGFEYGYFMPGKAYREAANDAEQFFGVRVTQVF